MTFDYLNLRRLQINYASPALCESVFSSTSEPTIILEPWAANRAPTGLLGEVVDGGIHFSWDVYPGALCYSLYKAIDALDPFSEYILVTECTENSDIVIAGATPGKYRVGGITPTGETEFSEPFIVEEPPAPPCLDCQSPSHTVADTAGWALIEDTPTKKVFSTYAVDGVLNFLGLHPYGLPVYVMMYPDYTYYFEPLQDAPAYQHVWCGRRCTIGNPNGNYEVYVIDPGDTSQFATDVRAHMESFGPGFSLEEATQHATPNCVEVNDIQEDLWGIPGE